jgi:uncharacterized protein (TIGR03083 family)
MDDWLGALGAQTERFAAAVERGDLAAPISHCPGWTLLDLGDHLGGVHQWAAHAVVSGTPDLDPAPSGAATTTELAEWYRGHAAHLIEVLAGASPDASAWTFDEADPTAGFWRRRQVHETTLHVWDVEHALGEPSAIDPVLAWDGVLEVVDVMYPRQVRLGRVAPIPGQVLLVAADGPGRATLGDGDPLEVRAPSEVLLRLLWHRADPADAGLDPRVGVLLAGAVTP